MPLACSHNNNYNFDYMWHVNLKVFSLLREENAEYKEEIEEEYFVVEWGKFLFCNVTDHKVAS